jgi:hypothetical protein
LKRVDAITKGIQARAQIRHLDVDLQTPVIEIGLSRPELVDGSLDIGDLVIAVVDAPGLLVELGDDEGELVFNLHGDLKAGTMVMSQCGDLEFDCQPNQPRIGPMKLAQSTPKWITEI